MKLFEIKTYKMSDRLPDDPREEDDERARAHREMLRKYRQAPEKPRSVGSEDRPTQEREKRFRASLSDEKYEQIKSGSSIQTKYTAVAPSKEAAEKRASQIGYAYRVVDKKITPDGDKFKLEITYYS